ncbi:formyl transferase [candidate division GN15 bacterium]|nr:formyl transferase [candidate division GN15 bacterium]
MNILLLGPDRPHLVAYLESLGDTVTRHEKKLKGDSPVLDGIDFVVSYGYQYILKDAVLARFPGRVVNLHISLLPWNRGRDPNLWSFLEDTPKGVTIHYIDRGVDTGHLIAQREVTFGTEGTLRTTYDELSRTIEELFREQWPAIREGRNDSRPQPTGGSSHRGKDKEPYMHLLHSGWDTPVAELIGKALSSAKREDG